MPPEVTAIDPGLLDIVGQLFARGDFWGSFLGLLVLGAGGLWVAGVKGWLPKLKGSDHEARLALLEARAATEDAEEERRGEAKAKDAELKLLLQTVRAEIAAAVAAKDPEPS